MTKKSGCKKKEDIGFILGIIFIGLVTIYVFFLQSNSHGPLTIDAGNSITGATIGGSVGTEWAMPFLVLGAFVAGLFACRQSCKH